MFSPYLMCDIRKVPYIAKPWAGLPQFFFTCLSDYCFICAWPILGKSWYNIL